MFYKCIFVIILAPPALTSVKEEIVNSKGSDDPGVCFLPPYPEHGNYTSNTFGNKAPEQGYDLFSLEISCDPGYGVLGPKSAVCLHGKWNSEMPKCVRLCKLNKHPGVTYSCRVAEYDILGPRDCNDWEPTGTLVKPRCKSPGYYSPGTLPDMNCIDGNWDYLAVCNEECGKIATPREELIVGANGYWAYRGQFPWHVGIYRKSTNPYMQICGGSLVSTTVVISGNRQVIHFCTKHHQNVFRMTVLECLEIVKHSSAAHCFWSDVEKKLPAANFAVAAGKLYRPWNDPIDENIQKSDVKEIKIPPRFQGNVASYQDDLALVVLTSPFVYSSHVRPVCLNFDYEFDKKQLQKENFGKVAGWGLTEKNVAAPILTVLNLPNVEIEKCISDSPPQFRSYITSDKICAGYKNGTALCMGDSGGGFAVPNTDKGSNRFYLRGIVSTAPREENLCNTFTFTAFTHILRHEHFIKENL